VPSPNYFEQRDVPTEHSADVLFSGGLAVPLRTSLPPNPRDGDITHIYVPFPTGWGGDVVWQFRRRDTNPDGSANASANKWDYIGGPPLQTANDSFSLVTAVAAWNAYGDVITTIPFTGDYNVFWGSRLYQTNNAGAQVLCGISINGATPTIWMDSYQGSAGGSTTLFAAHQTIGRRFALTAGDTLQMKFQSAQSGTVQNRWTNVTPFRVL
jgi:hypothetical protein